MSYRILEHQIIVNFNTKCVIETINRLEEKASIFIKYMADLGEFHPKSYIIWSIDYLLYLLKHEKNFSKIVNIAEYLENRAILNYIRKNIQTFFADKDVITIADLETFKQSAIQAAREKNGLNEKYIVLNLTNSSNRE